MNTVVKAKVWLEFGQGVALCHGKAELLSAIDQFGSIRCAAQKINMSYKRAWRYIRELEGCLDEKVLSTSVGGRGGGGSQLTEVAKNLLYEYEQTKVQVNHTLTQNVRSFGKSF